MLQPAPIFLFTDFGTADLYAAANQASAADLLGLTIGQRVVIADR